MSYSSKVLWGEGLFLRPQHFQRQDMYHESRLREIGLALHPYSWGLRSVEIDHDSLSSGVLHLKKLSLILPDGEIYSAPGSDNLPAQITLDTLPADASEIIFYLALHQIKNIGGNYTEPAENTFTARFVTHRADGPDLFTNAKTEPIEYLKKSVKLIADSEPRDQFTSIPIVRIRRTSTNGFEVDDSFMPPCLSVEASPALVKQARNLLDSLQAKVNALYGHHREPSKNVIEFRSGDTASFWLLHTASSAYASLNHLFLHPALHPERLFQEMLRLAGALMTFSKSTGLTDLPMYEHINPEGCFAKLDSILRELLETVISTQYFAISLEETRPSFHLGRLDSGKIDDKTRFYLSVSADMPAMELVEAVPMRFKAGAPDDVEKLVLAAMPGIRFVYTPQAPAAIPVRPGAYYFALEARGDLYERMLQSQTITIYAPSGFKELTLELIAITS
jgi:type VI secretion system protein ImpJ